MCTLASQIQYFSSELLSMIDAGKEISVIDFVEKMENGSIVDFIHKECPKKNKNFSPNNAAALKFALQNLYVSENEAYTKRIENNGLVYLVSCLMELLQQELFILSDSEQN